MPSPYREIFINLFFLILFYVIGQSFANFLRSILYRVTANFFGQGAFFYRVEGIAAIFHGILWLIQGFILVIGMFMLISKSTDIIIFLLPGIIVGTILGARKFIKQFKKGKTLLH